MKIYIFNNNNDDDNEPKFVRKLISFAQSLILIAGAIIIFFLILQIGYMMIGCYNSATFLGGSCFS